MDWSETYQKRIRRLRQRIPANTFQCVAGCSLCCKGHAWTWAEWRHVTDRRYAKRWEDPCPYLGEKGCDCYEERPVICRLYGCAGAIGPYGKFQNVKLSCPAGFAPFNPIPEGEAREIFLEFMRIVKGEADDAKDRKETFAYAGPYGAYVREE